MSFSEMFLSVFPLKRDKKRHFRRDVFISRHYQKDKIGKEQNRRGLRKRDIFVHNQVTDSSMASVVFSNATDLSLSSIRGRAEFWISSSAGVSTS